jgi:folate-binding protein YgfZ
MSDAYKQALEGAVVFDQSDRGKIIVSGADAKSFLHNLSTNDIKSLKPGMGCEAFFATAQAKAVSFARIFCDNSSGSEYFWLDLEPGQASKLVKHLDRFIISEQVELKEVSAEYGLWHVAGPDADNILTKTGLHEQHATRPCDRLNVAGWDVICPRKESEQLREFLTQGGAIPADLEVFNVLRIEAGIPVYGIDIDENRFVVEVGRTKQAISYTKGCYLGQEPIVMARDRGHVNRMMMGLRICFDEPLLPGTEVAQAEMAVGAVTSSIVSPRFGSIALAYIRRGFQAPGTTLQWTMAGSAGTAEVTTLPFVT